MQRLRQQCASSDTKNRIPEITGKQRAGGDYEPSENDAHQTLDEEPLGSVPLLSPGNITHSDHLLLAVIAFFAFSLGPSGVHIFNDLHDVEADRNHPRKKHRPIASGKVPIPAAVLTCCICLLASITITLFFASDVWSALTILGFYLLANVGYSLGLKNVPIIDIAILASGFVFRILFGGAMCGIQISSWLLLTILALSVFFALGKRRGELLRHGSSMRKSLESYTLGFLDKNLYVYLGIGLVFYSLWTFERIGGFNTALDVSSVALILGIPIVMMMCLRYSMDIESSDSDGDPMEVVFGRGKMDKALITYAILWCLDMLIALYVI